MGFFLSFVFCLVSGVPEPMHSNARTQEALTKHPHPHADSNPREQLSQNDFSWHACSFAILDADSSASQMTATRLSVFCDRSDGLTLIHKVMGKRADRLTPAPTKIWRSPAYISTPKIELGNHASTVRSREEAEEVVVVATDDDLGVRYDRDPRVRLLWLTNSLRFVGW
ncbi:hypothetical protein PG995_006991 [Apiospora arundinis]